MRYTPDSGLFASIFPPADPANPFYEDYATDSAAGKSNIETSILEEDWVKELMEDLDVFIAERNFEDAVDSIEKVSCKSMLASISIVVVILMSGK